MPDQPPSSQEKRRPGGQPGNTNAIRHGLYSKYFTEIEMQGLDTNVTGEFTDELAFARVQLGRLAKMLENHQDMPFADYIAATNAANNLLDRIQRLSRAQQFMYRNQTTLEQAIAELAAIPPEED
jgi:hypothetical protein